MEQTDTQEIFPRFLSGRRPRLLDQDEPKEESAPSYTPVEIPPSTGEKPSSHSVGGFAGNFVDDAVENVKGIGRLLFVGLPKFVVDTVKDPAHRAEQIGGLFSSQTLPKIWDAITSNYKDGFWEGVYQHPFSAAMDAAAVLSLGGGTIAKLGGADRYMKLLGEAGKLAEAGDTAGVSAKLTAANAAKEAADASRVVQTGKTIAGAGRLIDPFHWAAKGIGAIGRPFLESFGIGEHSDQLMNLEAQVNSGQGRLMAQDVEKVLTKGLSEGDQLQLHRALFRGSEDDLKALGQEARARYDSWEKHIEGPQERYLGPEGKRMLSQDALEKAKAKGASWAHFGDTSAEHVAEASRNIESGMWKPKFASMFRAGDPVNDLWESLNRELGDRKQWGRLEARRANGLYETNPDVYMLRQIKAYHGAVARLRFSDVVQQEMARQGKLKVIRAGESVPEGYALLKDPIAKKYWQDMTRVQAAAMNDFGRGIPIEEALSNAADAFSKDPALTRQAFAGLNGAEIAVPKDVAGYMNRAMAVPSQLTRWYDKIMGAWKPLVTMFNPKYWGSVVFGNASLGLLYGVGPDALRTVFHYGDKLPTRLLQKLSPEFIRADMTTYGRLADRLGQYSHNLDVALKQSVFAHEAMPVVRQRMLAAGQAFFPASDAAAEELQRISQAPDRYLQQLEDLQTLQEDAARRLNLANDLKRQLGKAQKSVNAAYKKLGAVTGRRVIEQEGVDLGHVVGGPTAKETPIHGYEGGYAGKSVKLGAAEHLYPAQGKELGQYDFTGSGPSKPPPSVPPPKAAQGPYDYEPMPRNKPGERIPYDFEGHPQPQSQVYPTQGGKPAKFPKGNEALYQSERLAQPGPYDYTPSGKSVKLGAGQIVDGVTGQPIRSAEELFPAGVAPSKDVLTAAKAAASAQEIEGSLSERLKILKAEALDRLSNIAQIRQALPEAAAEADRTNRLIKLAESFTGSMDQLHPVERNVVRRVIPFYTFTKAMTMLAFRMPFQMPRRAFMWSKLSKLWIDSIAEDNRLPDWTRDYVPVATDKDGNVVMVRLGSWSPFNGVRTGSAGEQTMPNLIDVADQNPLVKLIFSLKGGTDQWSKRPMSPGEYATRLDNGTVVQYDNGRFKTVLAQPSLWRSLWYLFPQSQMIDSVLTPYMQTDRGWLLNPQPILKRDGSVMYPKELLDGLSSFVGLPPVTRANPEQLQMAEQRRVQSVIKSFLKDLRSDPPEKKLEVRQILQEWASGRMNRVVQR